MLRDRPGQPIHIEKEEVMISDFVTAAIFSVIGVLLAAVGAVLTDAVQDLAVSIAAGSAIGAFLGSLLALGRGQSKQQAENTIWFWGTAGAGVCSWLFVVERLLG